MCNNFNKDPVNVNAYMYMQNLTQFHLCSQDIEWNQSKEWQNQGQDESWKWYSFTSYWGWGGGRGYNHKGIKKIYIKCLNKLKC